MAPKFSPGPWRFEDSQDLGAFLDANGEMVCGFGESEDSAWDGSPPNAADKRLIAAGPEMYAELAFRVGSHVRSVCPCSTCALLKRIDGGGTDGE